MLPKAPTAASGVRKVGIMAVLSTVRASPTEASPIQQVNKGLLMRALKSASAAATAAASQPVFGEWMTRIPSISFSLLAASSASR